MINHLFWRSVGVYWWAHLGLANRRCLYHEIRWRKAAVPSNLIHPSIHSFPLYVGYRLGPLWGLLVLPGNSFVHRLVLAGVSVLPRPVVRKLQSWGMFLITQLKSKARAGKQTYSPKKHNYKTPVCWGITWLVCTLWVRYIKSCCLFSALTHALFTIFLQLNAQSLKYTSSENDICCNVSTSTKSLPLTSLKSVDVRGGCCIDCGVDGIKQVMLSNHEEHVMMRQSVYRCGEARWQVYPHYLPCVSTLHNTSRKQLTASFSGMQLICLCCCIQAWINFDFSVPSAACCLWWSRHHWCVRLFQQRSCWIARGSGGRVPQASRGGCRGHQDCHDACPTGSTRPDDAC